MGGIAKSKNLLLRERCLTQVYLGVWHEQEVSVKLARQKPISLKAERQFQQHVAKLHALQHPNVVGFMGACCWKVGCCASCLVKLLRNTLHGTNLAFRGKGLLLPCSLFSDIHRKELFFGCIRCMSWAVTHSLSASVSLCRGLQLYVF